MPRNWALEGDPLQLGRRGECKPMRVIGSAKPRRANATEAWLANVIDTYHFGKARLTVVVSTRNLANPLAACDDRGTPSIGGR